MPLRAAFLVCKVCKVYKVLKVYKVYKVIKFGGMRGWEGDFIIFAGR